MVYFKSDNITSSPNLTSGSDFSVFTAGVSLTLWAFIGVESATVPSVCYNPEEIFQWQLY